jgi:uncharacterized protein YciI
MLAVRVALSNPEKAAARATYLEDHKRHLRSGRLRIVQSGPILDEAGEGSGGVVVADVVSLEEMREFSAQDPFVLHEVYSSISIYEWRPSIDGRG